MAFPKQKAVQSALNGFVVDGGRSGRGRRHVAGGFICTHEEGDDRSPLAFEAYDDGAIDYAGALDTLAADPVAKAVDQARGGIAPPAEKVGFG